MSLLEPLKPVIAPFEAVISIFSVTHFYFSFIFCWKDRLVTLHVAALRTLIPLALL